MYAIIGAFGQTGQAASQALLNAGQSIRMIVRRDDDQAVQWRAKGAEVVTADVGNVAELTTALTGTEGVYLMNPPAYLVPDLFAEAKRIHAALVNAANNAAVPHVVALSSVGAQHAHGTGNILTTHDFENQLAAYQGQLSILRAANFLENWAWSLPVVLEKKILPSLFHPVDKALPMVSALDIGRTAASMLMDPPKKHRLVELHGPQSYSPVDAAHALSQLLGYSIQAIEDSPDHWSNIMLNMGWPKTTVNAFVEMFAGFNTDHIIFEGTHETRRGEVSLTQAISAMLKNVPAHH